MLAEIEGAAAFGRGRCALTAVIEMTSRSEAETNFREILTWLIRVFRFFGIVQRERGIVAAADNGTAQLSRC